MLIDFILGWDDMSKLVATIYTLSAKLVFFFFRWMMIE